MLPAYFANMAPVIMRKVFVSWAVPLDFRKKLGAEDIFGSHKTVRGFLFAIIFGLAAAFIQNLLSGLPAMQGLAIVDYAQWPLIGFLLGFGAIAGDLIKSFFKRRFHVAPGSSFIPWDQLDFVLGALLMGSLITDYSLKFFVTAVLISVAGLILVNHAAYFLKIRGERW